MMKQKEAAPAGNEWKERDVKEFSSSPFTRIGNGWMLITAGNAVQDKSNWNTMTASWGGMGVLWSKNVAFMFIRPTRHTFAFANNSSFFTLSFFDESRRAALALCGEKSGRDIDKASAAGLTPVFFEDGPGAVSFKEASDIFICKKLYAADFDPALFLDGSIEKCYPKKDYHRMFAGEIVKYLGR